MFSKVYSIINKFPNLDENAAFFSQFGWYWHHSQSSEEKRCLPQRSRSHLSVKRQIQVGKSLNIHVSAITFTYSDELRNNMAEMYTIITCNTHLLTSAVKVSLRCQRSTPV